MADQRVSIKRLCDFCIFTLFIHVSYVLYNTFQKGCSLLHQFTPKTCSQARVLVFGYTTCQVRPEVRKLLLHYVAGVKFVYMLQSCAVSVLLW